MKETHNIKNKTAFNVSLSTKMNPINMRCAPSKKFTEGSCISIDILEKMAHAYNQQHNNSLPIEMDETQRNLNPKGYKKMLVIELTKRLSDVCDDQICWTRQKFVELLKDTDKTDLQNYTFRPVGPQGRFTWLSTIDINNVMKQYETKYPNFKFFGAVPIDFKDLNLGLQNLDFANLIKNNKTQIGVIFNLDEHYKSGSHWVSMFADLLKGNVFYSDSYGYPPERRIRAFLKEIANFLITQNITPHVKSNKTRHQLEESECGVYSINFIARLLSGETFDEISVNRIPDEHINNCRTVYFNNVHF